MMNNSITKFQKPRVFTIIAMCMFGVQLCNACKLLADAQNKHEAIEIFIRSKEKPKEGEYAVLRSTCEVRNWVTGTTEYVPYEEYYSATPAFEIEKEQIKEFQIKRKYDRWGWEQYIVSLEMIDSTKGSFRDFTKKNKGEGTVVFINGHLASQPVILNEIEDGRFMLGIDSDTVNVYASYLKELGFDAATVNEEHKEEKKNSHKVDWKKAKADWIAVTESMILGDEYYSLDKLIVYTEPHEKSEIICKGMESSGELTSIRLRFEKLEQPPYLQSIEENGFVGVTWFGRDGWIKKDKVLSKTTRYTEGELKVRYMMNALAIEYLKQKSNLTEKKYLLADREMRLKQVKDEMIKRTGKKKVDVWEMESIKPFLSSKPINQLIDYYFSEQYWNDQQE